jgi:GNAT superfamily N-acetyltransferase
MPNLIIRVAQDSDRAAIQDVTLSAYREYAALMSDQWEEYRASILATLADVEPAARGQGIGAALIRECIQRARRSRAAALTLHTTEIETRLWGGRRRAIGPAACITL